MRPPWTLVFSLIGSQEILEVWRQQLEDVAYL